MAHRLPSSMRRLDRILKNGLSTTGSFNILVKVKPNYLELRQFLSQSKVDLPSKPPKGFDKHFHPKDGSNSAADMVGEKSEVDPKSSLSGGGDGRGGDKERSGSGAPGLLGKNNMRMLLAIGTTAGILGVCWWWVYFKSSKDFKGIFDNFLRQGGMENAEMGGDLKTKGHAAFYDGVPLVVLYCCCYLYLGKRGHKVVSKQLFLFKFSVFAALGLLSLRLINTVVK